MPKSIRKINRQKGKQAKKELRSLEKTVSSMPKKCSACGAVFNNETDLDTWIIEQRPDSIKLFCNICSGEKK